MHAILALTLLLGQEWFLAWPPPSGLYAVRVRKAPVIDGRTDDEAWRSAHWSSEFVDITGEPMHAPRFRTTMAWNTSLETGMPRRGLVGNFEPGFMLKLGRKDASLAVGLSRDLGLKTPVGDGTLATLAEGVAAGYGDRDAAAILLLRERAAGVEVRLK